MKFMIVNSKIKRNKTIQGVIRNLVLDFILYLLLHILYKKVRYTFNMSTG